MLEVLEAFAVIAVVVAVGAVVGYTGVLGDNARMVLNRVAFHIGVPALLLLSLSQATLAQIFSLPLLVSALAALVSFGLCFVLIAVVRRRSRGDSAVASWTASYVNAGNLGIPLSTYVFGNTTEISALLLFQVVVMAPIGIAVLNSTAEPRRTPAHQIRALVTNPIIAASAVGLTLAAFNIQLTGPVADPLQLLADLAIPTVLLAFGISLSSRATDTAVVDRIDLSIVLALKVLFMPALAFVLAHWVFSATPEQTLLVTVLAALPAAQNINTYAAVYRRGETLARDATLVSTLLSIPVITAIVAFFG